MSTTDRADGAVDWHKVRRIAVFRALNLGDLLCTVPALRALREHLPMAHISLVGLPSARPVLELFPAYVDDLILFPGDPAFPEQPVQTDAVQGFYESMRAREFDLVLQMHGSGQRSNEVVREMAPEQWAGFVSSSQEAVPGRLLHWPDHLHEVHRYLALLTHIGVEARSDRYEFPVRAADDVEADALAARVGLEPERAVFIHPGARLPSRRWPVERYAAVAMALADDGWQIAITGSNDEALLAQRLKGTLGDGCIDLCGLTTLGTLASLLRRAKLLVCNDTGISHVAAGVHSPSVVVASGSDVARWAPLDRDRHRVLYTPVPCRPCGYDVCPIGHPCALGVEVEDVLEEASRKLNREEHV